MSLEDCIPPGDYVSTDYSDGSTRTTTRACALKYVALYGPPLLPWRTATPEEVRQLEEEDARLAALTGRYGVRRRAR